MKPVEINKELLRLVAENPDLPIYAWVDGEIVADDGYGYWLGKVCHVQVASVLTGWFDRAFDDKEEFKEYYFDWHNEEFEGLTDQQIEDRLDSICEAQCWVKAIILTISTPD